MPGANERALEKARTLPTDALILDLEDSVAPDAKEEARDRVAAAAASGAYGHREVTIRVNAPGTPWHADDLRAAAEAGPDAVVVPKVDTPGTSTRRAALEAAGAPDRTAVWAMIETPRGHVRRPSRSPRRRERLTVLVMGTNDLAKELHAEHVPGRAAAAHRPVLALLAARATGKVILDGVYNDVQDLPGFEAECLQGAAARLRRQDADPPQPARALQPDLRPRRGGGRAAPGGSSTPSIRPRHRAAAWSRWTAG